MSKIKIEKEEGRAAVGSCLRGYIKTSYEQLVRTFGEPGSDGDGYKTDAEWTVRINDELVTIYNYKNGPNYNRGAGPPVEEITAWNIGGFNYKVERLVERAVYGGIRIQ